MKFTASSADLLEALNTVKGAVPSKSTMPILECILFERDGDTLRLSATDLEISIIQTVPVRFELNGHRLNNRDLEVGGAQAQRVPVALEENAL